MAKEVALVKADDCIGCEACVPVCPTESMRMLEENNVAWSKPETCDGKEKCGKCGEVCPVECIAYVAENDSQLEKGKDKH